jgi:hypothetical protein
MGAASNPGQPVQQKINIGAIQAILAEIIANASH